MTKRFCNLCKKEIKGSPVITQVRARRYVQITNTIDLDFCEECFKTLIGEEEYNDLEMRRAEKAADIERRREERAKRKGVSYDGQRNNKGFGNRD